MIINRFEKTFINNEDLKAINVIRDDLYFIIFHFILNEKDLILYTLYYFSQMIIYYSSLIVIRLDLFNFLKINNLFKIV